MSTPRVAVIVVGYHGGSDLRRCLQALLETEYDDYHVLLVDNGGNQELHEWMRSLGPQLLLLKQKRNFGFAGGVNAGVDAVCGGGKRGEAVEIVALVNQDCIVEAGWLTPLVEALVADSNVALAGSCLLEADGITLQHAGGIIRANGLSDHIGRGSRDLAAYGECRRVDYVCGALCAFTMKTWSEMEGFDSGYFPAYYEEADFCFRAARRGMHALYLPTSRARHLEAGSSGAASLLFLKRYHRNRLRFSMLNLVGRGGSAAWLAAELKWLSMQRSPLQCKALLRAYAEVPRFLAERVRRSRGRYMRAVAAGPPGRRRAAG